MSMPIWYDQAKSMTKDELKRHLCGDTKGNSDYCLNRCPHHERCGYGQRLLELQGRLHPIVERVVIQPEKPIEKLLATVPEKKVMRNIYGEPESVVVQTAQKAEQKHLTPVRQAFKDAASDRRQKAVELAIGAAKSGYPVKYLIEVAGINRVKTALDRWCYYKREYVSELKPYMSMVKSNGIKGTGYHAQSSTSTKTPVEPTAPVVETPVVKDDDFETVVVKLKGKFGYYTVNSDGCFVIDALPFDTYSKKVDPIERDRVIPMLEEWLKAARRLCK